MALEPPSFLQQSGGFDAIAEFRSFASAVGSPAAHLLAELADIKAGGSPVPVTDDQATQVVGMFCRKIDGWAVFYRTSGSGGGLTVILVGVDDPGKFGILEGEADHRSRMLP